MNRIKEKKYDRRRLTYYTSFLLALWFCIRPLNGILMALFQTSRSLMAMLYILGAGFVLLGFLLHLSHHHLSVDRGFGLVGIYIVLLYFISEVAGVSDVQPPYFLAYFFVPFFIFGLLYRNGLVDFRSVLFWTSVLPAFGVFFRETLFQKTDLSTITMGTSYGFLTPILACLAFVLFYFRNWKRKYQFFYLLIILCNLIYLSELLQFGSRGPVVCFFVLLLIAATVKYEPEKEKIKLISGVRTLFIGLAVVLILVNFWRILEAVNEMVTSNFITKMLRLHAQDDVLNGRAEVFSAALAGIPERLFFGHGFSSFQYETGINYPHNIFLQLLFDGGVFLLTLVIIPLIRCIFGLFKHCSRNEFVAFTYLFSTAFVHSLVSGNMWENEMLWFFIAWCLVSHACKQSQERPVPNIQPVKTREI